MNSQRTTRRLSCSTVSRLVCSLGYSLYEVIYFCIKRILNEFEELVGPVIARQYA